MGQRPVGWDALTITWHSFEARLACGVWARDEDQKTPLVKAPFGSLLLLTTAQLEEQNKAYHMSIVQEEDTQQWSDWKPERRERNDIEKLNP